MYKKQFSQLCSDDAMVNVPDGVLADLGDQLSDELSPAATGNSNGTDWAGSKGNWASNTASNGSNSGTSESRSDDDLTGTLGNEDAVSGDRPEGLALPLGLVDLLEGVALLGGGHEVGEGRSQDATGKLEEHNIKT